MADYTSYYDALANARGERLSAPEYTPSQRLGNASQDFLSSLGAQPSVARHLVDAFGGLLGLTPAAIPVAAADAVYAKAKGNDLGTVQAMAGMIPGVGPEVRGAARYAQALAEGKITKAEYEGFVKALGGDAAPAAAAEFPSIAAARAELNDARSIVEKYSKKNDEWSNGGPKLTPDERLEWQSAFPRLSKAQQYLIEQTGKVVKGHIPSDNPVVDSARRRLSLDTAWRRNQSERPSWAFDSND